MRELVEQLREANKKASQQSKMSHDTAKRYYDRHTKMEQFKKGDYVYVHNPVYKWGKAKKISYQYEGPFEVEQKISSLIYKVRLGDGTSIILHINGLKRAHKQDSGHRKMPEENIGQRKAVKIAQPRKSSCGRRESHVKKGGVRGDDSPPCCTGWSAGRRRRK